MKNKYKGISYFIVLIAICVFCFGIVNRKLKTINTSGVASEDFSSFNNKKICWGIKRAENHEQPDVGSQNKDLMEKCDAMYMGIQRKNMYI